MYLIDSAVKQEALNFATLLNLLKCTEYKLEPKFRKFSNFVDATIPLIDERLLEMSTKFFEVSEERMQREYMVANRAFSTLRPGDEILKRGSPDYPFLLANTPQAPRFLYIRGKKFLLHETKTVAIAGSRKASENAISNAGLLTKVLCRNGFAIISGLAKGVDAAAHKEALQCGGNTIAVIGTHLNGYYPAENKDIQKEIEKEGLVVSQFSPATKTERWSFPMRDGIISGLSIASIIMEAHEKSGSLILADYVLKQGRTLMFPANIVKQKKLNWPQEYIKKGAVAVSRPSDVLKILSKAKGEKNEEY